MKDINNVFEKYEERIKIEKMLKKTKLLSIDERLDKTRKLTITTMEKIRNIDAPKEFEANMKECIKSITKLQKTLPKIKDTFMHDKVCKNGFVKKSVVKILKSKRYRKHLNIFCTNIRQNHTKSYKDFQNYMVYYNLSANPKEIGKTLNIIEKGLPVLIYALERNDYISIMDLCTGLELLIARIIKLYEFYKIYLKDIDEVAEYNLIFNVLEDFDYTLHYLGYLNYELEKFINEKLENEEENIILNIREED